MTADPTLRFWLGWAESQGALHEAAPDSTLVVLPRRLQVALGFDEEVAVTSDPEVAREDDAVLLAHGHPALDHATDDVLGQGDVGRVTLACPASVPPDADGLLARARDVFPVEHGRIDPAGVPVAAHRPVLRVAALLTHSVSLEDRFNELAEVWVDVPTGLALPDAVRERLAATDQVDAGTGAGLPAELSAALEAVHRLMEDGATARRDALAFEIGDTRADELTRIRSYFDAALHTLRRRRESAPAERRPLYDAREAATQAERARRLVEVEEKWRPRTDVRPFRLHLLRVPSLVLPVLVRRGPRSYTSALEWLRPAAGFAALRCPQCTGPVQPGAPGLVAGKQRLGCLQCMTTCERTPASTGASSDGDERPAPRARLAGVAAASGGAVHAARAAERATPGAESAAPRRPAPSRPRTVTGSPAPHRPSEDLAGPRRPASRQPSALPEDAERLAAAGEKLAVGFWQAASDGQSRPLRRLLLPGSPLAALIAVEGAALPCRIVGLGPGEVPGSVTAGGVGDPLTSLQLVSGHVMTRRQPHSYSLRWELVNGRALAVELLAAPGAVGRWLPKTLLWHDRLADHLGEPRVQLDPVATALWKVVRPEDGLLLCGRCLAAWWRTGGDRRLDDQAPAVVAAAVHHQVAWRAGWRTTYADVARLHRVDEREVRRVATAVQAVLQLSAGRCW